MENLKTVMRRLEATRRENRKKYAATRLYNRVKGQFENEQEAKGTKRASDDTAVGNRRSCTAAGRRTIRMCFEEKSDA